MFVAREAALHRITGYVRNLEDGGGVEVVASGGESDVDDLILRLRHGPPAASVVGVDTHAIDPPYSYTDFRIRY
jgi:acylphosphatase